MNPPPSHPCFNIPESILNVWGYFMNPAPKRKVRNGTHNSHKTRCCLLSSVMQVVGNMNPAPNILQSRPMKVRCLCPKCLGAVMRCRSRKTLGRGRGVPRPSFLGGTPCYIAKKGGGAWPFGLGFGLGLATSAAVGTWGGQICSPNP